MSLTTQGKNYIATQFGVGNCMVHSGLAWTTYGSDGASTPETGGTAKIISRLVTSGITRVQLTSPRSGSYTSSDLTSNNQSQTVDYSDASWISNNDGYPSGETQYCASTVSSPTPTTIPATTVPGLAGTHVFVAAPTGTPTVDLNTSEIEMSQSTSDYHFEIDDLYITNTSAYKTYIAVRCKLFSGELNSCPASGEVFDGMDRVSTSRNVRIKTLDPGEIEDINADFYQPAHILGAHTICLIIHGSFNKTSLQEEIAYIAG